MTPSLNPSPPLPAAHLPQVGSSLGYHGLGLGALTRQVLGFVPPKCRKVTMSNWEARQLSAKQQPRPTALESRHPTAAALKIHPRR